mgnify:CR=1 FL=1
MVERFDRSLNDTQFTLELNTAALYNALQERWAKSRIPEC